MNSPLASSFNFEFGPNNAEIGVLISDLESIFSKDINAIRETNPSLQNDKLFTAAITALGNVMRRNLSLVPPYNLPRPMLQKQPVRVYMDGCFDIMHSGHYNAIRQAKSLGDILVVGVHSDAEILQNKGPPVMNERERLEAVRACKWIDEVVFDTPYTPSLALLDSLHCDFCVHGDDMPTDANGTNAYAEVIGANRIRIIKRTEGVSTTDLVGRLLLMTKDHHLPSLSSVDMKPPHTRRAGSQTSLSSFLPTTWRISQFANNRRPPSDAKVVYVSGAFDLFHVGHMETLQKARELGDFLYVGVHDDESVNKQLGGNYPIMNLHERVLNVLSCKWVDEVILGAPLDINSDLIRTLNISLVAVGGNLDRVSDDQFKQQYEAAKQLDMLLSLPCERQLRTADVVERIVRNRAKYQRRNASRELKESEYLSSRTFVEEI